MTAAYRQSAETNTSPDLLLLEFSERGGSVVERAVLNNENVIFESNTFYRSGFDCNIPSADEMFKAPSLTFSNVGRVAGQAVLAARDRIVCRMIHVDGGDFTVSGGVRTYHNAIQDTKNMVVITDVTGDVMTISGSLGAALSADLPYPNKRSLKSIFRGAYM